ncbi:MAG: methyltransferase domain-containing protein, partial [Chitinophagaceae bacterium]
MKFDDAVSLVGVPGLATNGPSTWADLGAGTGLFSVAIASLLAKQSVVYAVDKAPGIKEQTTTNAVRIVPVRKNFVSDELQLPVLDGIVMANSLHFVIDKPPMFARLRSMIRPGGILI